MSDRAEFEQRFPAPAGIYWNEISEQYDALPGAAGFDDVEIYHGKWQAWQAARAQGEPSSEVPEGWKLVPVEPTESMITAFEHAPCAENYTDAATWSWRAMLSAAPAAQVEGGTQP